MDGSRTRSLSVQVLVSCCAVSGACGGTRNPPLKLVESRTSTFLGCST